MNKRQEKILDMLCTQGEVAISLLPKLLNVSDMTVYRDVCFLESEGLLVRKRGAIQFINKNEPTSCDRYMAEKTSIAREAAKLIHEGDSVIFDNSTTALEVAKQLKNMKSLTVYATNVHVVSELCGNPDIALYCSGGYYSHSSTGFVGSVAEEFVQRVQADKCIIGTAGISATHGLTCPYPMHANLQKKIMASAATVIVVADHTKFCKVAIETTGELSQVDYLVTDAAVEPEKLKQVEHLTRVIVAKE